MDVSYNCPNCGMSLRSKGLMVKHQRHFCVGAEEEGDECEQEIHQAKVKGLERLQHQKNEAHTEWEEKEERLLDDRDESEGHSSESDSSDEENSEELINLQRKFPLPTIDSSEEKANLIELEAEAHNKRLAEQQQQMEDLISQKRAIENRLREFERERLQPTSLDQLMAQQKNEVSFLQLQRDHSMKPDSLNLQKQHDFLLKHINAVRQRYLENGGCNPEILLDIAVMEKDAIDLLERHLEVDQVELQNKEKCRILNEELEAFESQNRDLEEELLNLHEANTERLEQKVNDYDETIARELLSGQRKQHRRELERIEQELELANQEIRLNRIKLRLEKLK